MGVIMRNGIQYAGTPKGGSGGSSEAIDINYDNTSSQLESVNVQDALDEINDKIKDVETTVPSITYEEYINNLDKYKDIIVNIIDIDGDTLASAVVYDNQVSGLEVTNVQDALDYLVEHGGGGGSSADKISYDNTESSLIAENVQSAIDEVASIDYILTANESETINLPVIEDNFVVDLKPYCTLNSAWSSGFTIKEATFKRTGNVCELIIDVIGSVSSGARPWLMYINCKNFFNFTGYKYAVGNLHYDSRYPEWGEGSGFVWWRFHFDGSVLWVYARPNTSAQVIRCDYTFII